MEHVAGLAALPDWEKLIRLLAEPPFGLPPYAVVYELFTQFLKKLPLVK